MSFLALLLTIFCVLLTVAKLLTTLLMGGAWREEKKVAEADVRAEGEQSGVQRGLIESWRALKDSIFGVNHCSENQKKRK